MEEIQPRMLTISNAEICTLFSLYLKLRKCFGIEELSVRADNRERFFSEYSEPFSISIEATNLFRTSKRQNYPTTIAPHLAIRLSECFASWLMKIMRILCVDCDVLFVMKLFVICLDLL
jgi:hypothetical protein